MPDDKSNDFQRLDRSESVRPLEGHPSRYTSSRPMKSQALKPNPSQVRIALKELDADLRFRNALASALAIG